jgi:peptidoglycan/xylan/chitin deacetylase (PgdA/CDA1 family)
MDEPGAVAVRHPRRVARLPSIGRMNRSRSRVLALVLATGLVAVACSGGSDTSTTAPVTTSSTSTTTPTTTTTTSTTTTTTTLPPTTTVPPTTTAAPRPPVTVAPSPIDPNAPVGQRIQRGANGKPYVALTFDAGSDYGYTDQILDFLKAEGIKASFGMTGAWAEKYPDGFKRIVAEGHHLINHSYSHGSWTGVSSGKAPLTADQRRAEVERADAVFAVLGAKTTKPWYRPPYGDLDKAGEQLLGQIGYPYIAMWSVDSLGWQGLSPEAIAARCARGTVAGAIFLFHVGIQSLDAEALPAIVATIREAGLTPGSVLDVAL